MELTMADKIEVTKTGECLYLDENGNLCLAETFVDKDGVTTSTSKVIETKEPDTSE